MFKERIIELNKTIGNKTEIARIVHGEFPERFNNVETARNVVKRVLKKSGVQIECEKKGIPLDNVDYYWYKGKRYSIHVDNRKSFDQEEFISKLKEEVRSIAPTFKPFERKQITEKHALVISLADLHIGKLCSAFETGEDYNQEIAVKRALEGVNGLLEKSKPFNIEKIYFVTGNDILHIDTPKRTTTSGTPQDTDGMWYDNFIKAKRLLIDIISKMMWEADVEVVYNPSNHDFMSGFMLLQAIEAYFMNCQNVKFNNDMSHRKYSVYGQNLIMTTHMDGAKMADLPLLMAHESGVNWHQCKHRYVYGHHVHHKNSKDLMSVCVETLRSPSGTDSWHHRNGYQYAPKAIEAFVHHEKHGQVARLTHLF